MLEPKIFLDKMSELGVEFFTGIPDSLLKHLCAYITDNTEASEHIIAANEGASVGLAIGHHLATGKVPLVYMQNSGLGNTVNPLLSLADKEVYSTPMLLLIGWRGQPGVKDEPQHVKQGRITEELLSCMEIPFETISKDSSDQEMSDSIQKLINFAREESRPVAMLVGKGTFNSYKPSLKSASKYEMTREQAIECIAGIIDDEAAIVSTTGVASRELFEYRANNNLGHERDFLTVGGMGHASQIGLGVAFSKKDQQVFCFDGDGSALMHMGSVAISGQANLANFKHIVFNNGVHDSVGGQPTVALEIDLPGIAKCCGYEWVHSVSSLTELKKAITEMQQQKTSSFLEVRVAGGFRSDLGRPTTTPVENKKALMKFLSK